MRSACLRISKRKRRWLEFSRFRHLIAKTYSRLVVYTRVRQRLPLRKLIFLTPVFFPIRPHGKLVIKRSCCCCLSLPPFFPPPPPNHISNSLAGWRNINMLNNLMKVHVRSCTRTPTLTLVLLHGRTGPRCLVFREM